jgi:two-component sensor histidine kinase
MMIGNRFHSVARAASIVSIALGVTGLVRWILDRSTFVSAGPKAPTTMAAPAIGLILAGASLLPRIKPGGSWRRAWFSRTCALGTMAIGMATLAGSALGIDLGIDQLLMRAPDAAGPGRMAPNTALGLALAGAALGLLEMRFRVLRTVSQAMALILLLIGLVACTGYVVGIGGLYDITGSPSMPIHTAAGFTALSLGILLARPQGGILAVIAQDNAAGAMIRWLLPLIVVMPLAVAWVRLKGQEAGFHGTEFGLVLMVTTSTVIIGFCAVWNSRVRGSPPVERVLRDGEVIDVPDRVVRVAHDGAEHPLVHRAAPMHAADGTVRGALLVFRDAELERDPPPGVQFDFAEDPAPGRRRLAVAHQFLAQLRGLNRELEAQVRARNAQLSALLREREVLLQEVHHRVQNNLQVIASLINMQIRRRENGAPRNGLAECKARIDAIALIHEKLYQSDDHACVQFSDYARTLASHVFSTTGVSRARVTLDVDVESIALPVDKAIPCGLILNELLANALEHAFPGDRRGAVRVELVRTAGGDIRLSVSDDGVGMTPDIDPASAASLGMHLVSTLVEQLDGHLEVIRHNGTRFWITFR